VLLLVIRALGIFEAERRQEIARLAAERLQAQQASFQTESRARQVAENWTNALVTISRRIAHMENVDEALHLIVDLARRLLNADTAALALWDESGLQLELKCYAAPQATQSHGPTPITHPLILKAVRTCRAARFPDDTGPLADGWICPVLNEEVRSAVIVPLQLDQRSLGGLWITRLAPATFTLDEVSELERLADQAVIALEHALMAARLQSLAILEERSRIAREMHDGLAQVLGYLSLETQTLEALVRRGECEAALAELKGARTHILEAQADVRENILSLRTTLSGQAGLIPALQEYVGEFEVQTGIKTAIVNDLTTEPHLSPLAEAQLIRIVQEALTNVRKHARATQAHLQLTAPDGCLRVQVADDGCGFEAAAVGRGHFGLHTMRERAESVGGGCTIRSAPGAGTHIELWLPVVQA
jgi:signal transduction histidine kinase